MRLGMAVVLSLLLLFITWNLRLRLSPQSRADLSAASPGNWDDSSFEPGLTISAVDRVYVEVWVDEEIFFKGRICPNPAPACDHLGKLETPLARNITAEISDLNRVKLEYRRKKVDPLGNLIRPRRLIFSMDEL